MDDTIILAETPESLQNALNSFENYCTRWKLKGNPDIFSPLSFLANVTSEKGRIFLIISHTRFYIIIEIMHHFKKLSINISIL
jgi:hypothetical protein